MAGPYRDVKTMGLGDLIEEMMSLPRDYFDKKSIIVDYDISGDLHRALVGRFTELKDEINAREEEYKSKL